MILKNGITKKVKKTQIVSNFFIAYFVSTISVFIIFGVFFFTSYTVKSKALKVLDYLSKAGRIEYVYIFNIAYKAFKSNFYKVERIDLDIKFDDIIALEKEREIGIKKGSLGAKDNLSKIPVILKYYDKKIKSKIRLKGDRRIHFEKKKHSSYNVYLPKNEYIFGINSFSIHKPGVKNYIHEWIFTEMVGDLGLIKQKYKFFDLYINGTKNGLYALEEKIGKEILERNKKTNGPIFSRNDDYSINSNDNTFKVYDQNFWTSDENILLTKKARKKLTEFFKGSRTAEKTFHMEKFAAFFAIIDATYTMHSLFSNLKLYYNPLSELFEPIPRDGYRQLPNYHKFNNNYYNKIVLDAIYVSESIEQFGENLKIINDRRWWLYKFFTHHNGEINYKFYKLYIKHLTKISSEEYLNSFFDKRKQEIERINSLIYSDYFFYSTSKGYTWGLYYFKKDDLLHRANIIRDRLQTENKNISAIIDDNKNLVIEVAYPYYDKVKSYKRLDDLLVKSINCVKVKNTENITNSSEVILEKIIINKPVDIFLNKKIKLDPVNFNNLKCSTITILDNQFNKNHIVEIDKLNSF